MSKKVSIKAQAWQLAAKWCSQQVICTDLDIDPELRLHILLYVIPSMKRRAGLIERNRKMGAR